LKKNKALIVNEIAKQKTDLEYKNWVFLIPMSTKVFYRKKQAEIRGSFFMRDYSTIAKEIKKWSKNESTLSEVSKHEKSLTQNYVKIDGFKFNLMNIYQMKDRSVIYYENSREDMWKHRSIAPRTIFFTFSPEEIYMNYCSNILGIHWKKLNWNKESDNSISSIKEKFKNLLSRHTDLQKYDVDEVSVKIKKQKRHQPELSF
jgi:hypothetical protein